MYQATALQKAGSVTVTDSSPPHTQHRAYQHDKNVTAGTLRLLAKLKESDVDDHHKAHYIQRHVDKSMNDELEVLASLAMLIECEPTDREPRVFALVLKADAASAVREAVSIMRRRFAKLLRDHEREDED